jgi:PAS domain S-box-containing protein
MQQNQTINVGGMAAQLVLGGLTLALVVLASFRFHADLATTAFACLIVVLLFSLMGSFVASVLLCLLAVAALDYFFAAPVFRFAIDDLNHIVVVAAFLLTTLLVTRLIGNARKDKEAALAAEGMLRRSRAEVQASEQQWREVFEHNPVMYFMLDAEGLVLNVNTFGATQLGYSVKDLVGQSVLKVFLEEDRLFVQKCVGVCLESIGRSHTWEIQKIRKNGSVLWVRENAKAMRRADGCVIVLIACEDITERRATECALQQSEAYLAQAQEISRTGSFGWNVATGEIIWSKETLRIFECDPADKPTPALIFARMHPEDRAAAQALYDRASSDGKDYDHQYRLLMPDGRVKHLHARARATINGAGDLEFCGAITDITDAKEAEHKLRRSEAYLAEAQRLSHTSSWAWDVRRRDFIYRSAEFFRLFGFDPDEDVPAKAIQDRIPSEDIELQTEVIRRAVKQKDGELEFDFRIILPEGPVKRVHSLAHPVLGANGEVRELIGTHMDVTEQYVAREKLEQALVALRESEQRFRDYAETASDWLWETGPDHRVTQLSEHTKSSGIEATSVIGLFRWELAANPEAEADKWREHRATLDAHLPFRDLVYRSDAARGAAIYVRTSGKPFFDADGKFLGYRGVSTDITAGIRADQAERALRKAQAELAHVTRVTTLGELTASIAHEINQPLAALIANAEACRSWLDRGPPDLAAARRSVEWIVDDANRAGEVIRRVRALAKKTDTEKTLLDVNELVREAMALVQRELLKNEVSLGMELAPRLPSIYGDRVQLQQVIINLVMNGIEAMQTVGDRARRLVVRTGQDDLGRVWLAVADTGVGISEADSEHVFMPFFTTKSSGMGMGLAICRSIMEAHAGRLSVFRNEEGGATFQFVLPLHQEDAA